MRAAGGTIYRWLCACIDKRKFVAVMTRWSLSIPEETDRTVRLFLARNGGKKGDLSRLVDEAVRRYVFDVTVEQVKDRNAHRDQQELLDLIDAEVDAARAGRS